MQNVVFAEGRIERHQIGSEIMAVAGDTAERKLSVIDSNGQKERNLTKDPSADWEATWSPDSRWIAFVTARDSLDGDDEIYIMDTDGQDPRRLTEHAGNDIQVCKQ